MGEGYEYDRAKTRDCADSKCWKQQIIGKVVLEMGNSMSGRIDYLVRPEAIPQTDESQNRDANKNC
jgi:hypothetical protein